MVAACEHHCMTPGGNARYMGHAGVCYSASLWDSELEALVLNTCDISLLVLLMLSAAYVNYGMIKLAFRD